MQLTMTIDEAIAALQKAKEELGHYTEDAPTLILELPTLGLVTNVIDFVANKQDRSVRVVVGL